MNSTVSNQYDVVILGAGINGCGIAREIAGRGHSVLVVEKATIGSGTSSKSSRLIHGGLRYLEQLDFKLVREALVDRQELLRLYPDLVKLRSFYLPVYRSNPRPAWMIWLGLKLYDLLSGQQDEFKSKRVSRKKFLQRTPGFKREGLKGVFHYYDGKTNDLWLTQRVARDARERGTQFWENTTLKSIDRGKTRITVATKRGVVTTTCLINATGPWIDEVNSQFNLPSHYHIRKISGIHIVLNGLLTRDLMFMQTRGKRIFFIIPEPSRNRTIIGTTEREETNPVDEVRIHNEDVDYLIENINTYLLPEAQISPLDISDRYIGVRPLIAHEDNPTDLSREYALDLYTNENVRWLHVFGGKLTTFLSLAKKVADRLELSI